MSGVVHALHVASRERTELARLAGPAPTATRAAPPPPAIYATASVIDPETGLERFEVGVSTSDRHATPFAGWLHGVTERAWCRVRLERSGDPGP